MPNAPDHVFSGWETRNYEIRLHDPNNTVEIALELISNLRDIPTLRQYLVEQMKEELGVETTVGEQIKHLKQLADQRGIESLAPATLRAWLNGTRDPQTNHGSRETRENLYQLCGILALDKDATMELFLKYGYSRPFNTKIWQEAVYYWFALVHDEENGEPHWYQDSREFMNTFTLPTPGANVACEAITYTEILEENLNEIENAHQLASFLTENWQTFCTQNIGASARETVIGLIERCKEIAAYENNQLGIRVKNFIEDGLDTMSLQALLHIILHHEQRIDGYVRNAADLPPALVTNFPTHAILGDIANRTQEVSMDKYKKAILLLSFYAYYGKARKKADERNPVEYDRTDYSPLFENFYAAADGNLNSCGFCIYPRNPYDALFIYCASQRHPLDALREVISSIVFPKQ